MDVEQIEISQSEWEVMRVLWTLGPLKSSTLVAVLQDRMNWRPATTKTFLGRLVKKGALVTEKIGREFLYHPQIAEQNAMDAAVSGLFAHLCEMKVGTTIDHLLAHVTISQADVQALQHTVAQKAQTAPAMVACNCVPETWQTNQEVAHENH